MSENVFNQIGEGKLSGFMATITGRLTFQGFLGTVKAFDEKVVKRYLADDAYLEAANK